MEGRWITFTATAQGFVSTNPGNAIDFTFNYRRANLTWWTNTDWSFDLVEDNTAAADDVLAGDTDHKFSTPIFVTVYDNFTHSATSNILWIDVYELWIDYFRDNATSKDWKVVVNKNIAYNAIASSDCTNWEWDMADGVPDCWNPTGGDEKVSTTGPSPMVIPNSDLPSAGNWDHFGKAYGTIKVFCEDGEGNNHTFYSTSMYTSDFPAGWGTKKAEVFFEKSATTNPGGSTPNWYYYWKGGGVCGIDSSVHYDNSADYGFYVPGEDHVHVCNAAPGTNTGPETYTRVPGDSITVTGQGSGIDCVAETIAHEKYHKYVYETFNGQTDSDTDGVPDGEEPTLLGITTVAIASPDTYNMGGSYVAYGDEEIRCRKKELNTGITVYPLKDWSDTDGKNW